MNTLAPSPAGTGRTRRACFVLAIAAVLFVPTLFVRGLWAPDEPRYAAVAWHMSQSGNFLIPRLNGEIYDQKPALFFQLAATADRIMPAAGGRLIEAAATALLALLLAGFFAASELSAARLAPFVFLTTILGLACGKFGVIDGVLLLFLVLGVLLGRRALGSAHPLASWIGCLAAIAVGTLIKGPQIIPFALFALVGSLADIERKAPSRAHLAAIAAGAAVFFGIVLAWLVPACLAGGKEYTNVLIGQLWDRVTGERMSHNQPWHYYLAYAPAMFLPWTLLTAAAVVWGFRRVRSNVWLLCWIIGGFVLLSCFASKRERYLTMILPAGALLVARYLTQENFGRAGALLVRVTAVVLAVTGLALAGTPPVIQAIDFIGIPLLSFVMETLCAARLPYGAAEMLAGFSWYALWVITPLLGVTILAGAWITWRRAATPAAAYGIVLCGVAMSLAFDLVFTPALDPVKSATDFTARVREWSARGVTIILYDNDFDGRFNMALGKERLSIIQSSDAIAGTLASATPSAIIFRCRNTRDIEKRTALAGANLLAAGPMGGGRMLLIGNAAAAKACERVALPRT